MGIIETIFHCNLVIEIQYQQINLQTNIIHNLRIK